MSDPSERRPGRRRMPGIVLNVALSAICLLAGFLYSGYAVGTGGSVNGGSSLSNWAMVLWLVALGVLAGLCTWLWWRHVWPLAFTVAGAVAAIVLPLDASIALIGAVSLLHYRKGAKAWIGTAAAIVAAAWAFARDLSKPVASSAIAYLLTEAPTDHLSDRLEWNVPLATAIFTLVTGGIVIGLGLFWRSRTELVASHAAQNAERARREALANDLARSTERERVAREVHDSLGHELSLISLQAAAIELSDSAEPQLVETARSLRSHTQDAHKSLSELVDMLRSPATGPDPHGHVAEAPGLERLSSLFAESIEHGMQLSAIVLLNAARPLEAGTGRALYRIVQESLTNARRHAPGQPVRLTLSGNEREGVTLEVVNPRPRDAGPFAAGNGLVGMGERVELAGGSLQAGPTTAGEFAVTVWLPWSVAGQEPGAVD